MDVVSFSQIPLENLKGVLIDLDDTLYSYKTTHPLALEDCYEEAKSFLSLTKDEYFKLYRSKRDEFNEELSPSGACRSRLLAFQRMFEDLDIEKPFVKALEQSELYWKSLMEKADVAPEALSFLKDCKQKRLKVCIVTDMLTRIQIKKIQEFGLVEYVDHLVTSEETGHEKPNEAMFLTGLKKLNLNPSDVVMVGDRKAKDIDGAEAVGVRAFLVVLS